MEELTNLFNGVGVPVGVMIATFWFINTTMKENNKVVNNLTSIVENSKLETTKAMSDLTIAIEKLINKIEK